MRRGVRTWDSMWTREKVHSMHVTIARETWTKMPWITTVQMPVMRFHVCTRDVTFVRDSIDRTWTYSEKVQTVHLPLRWTAIKVVVPFKIVLTSLRSRNDRNHYPRMLRFGIWTFEEEEETSFRHIPLWSTILCLKTWVWIVVSTFTFNGPGRISMLHEIRTMQRMAIPDRHNMVEEHESTISVGQTEHAILQGPRHGIWVCVSEHGIQSQEKRCKLQDIQERWCERAERSVELWKVELCTGTFQSCSHGDQAVYWNVRYWSLCAYSSLWTHTRTTGTFSPTREIIILAIVLKNLFSIATLQLGRKQWVRLVLLSVCFRVSNLRHRSILWILLVSQSNGRVLWKDRSGIELSGRCCFCCPGGKKSRGRNEEEEERNVQTVDWWGRSCCWAGVNASCLSVTLCMFVVSGQFWKLYRLRWLASIFVCVVVLCVVSSVALRFLQFLKYSSKRHRFLLFSTLLLVVMAAARKRKGRARKLLASSPCRPHRPRQLRSEKTKLQNSES